MTSIDNTKRVAVMTSIAPNNIDNQRKAVSSWLAAGFKVMSYNCREEIEKLSPFFEDIEFIEAKRDARKEYGKPYVYFSDIMNFFKNSPCEICGIINSDIHIIGVNQGLIEFIMNEARDSLVFGQRVDIDTYDNLSGSMYIGFDYFFFDRNIVGIYPEEKFCIGQPVWDYWIIFIAAINNIKTKRLTNHIAYHIKHRQNWSEEANNLLTGVVLGKHMGFLGKNSLNHDEAYREYKRYVFHKNEDIYFAKAGKESSILIVYNDCGVKDTDNSKTFQSIVNQHYSNYRIMKGTLESLNITSIKEDMVYYISEGYIAGSHFLEIMSESIKEKEFAVCGVKVTYPETLSVDFIYPYNIQEKQNNSEIMHSCILYETDFLRNNGIPVSIDMYKASFVGQGMVELLSNYIQIQYYEERYESIVESYSDYCMPEILYYVAMSYKQLGNMNKTNIYFSILLEKVENHITNPSIIHLQYTYDGIADIILANDVDMDPDIWQRLYNFCIRRADIRYKLLNNLYIKKKYDKILEFESIDGEEVYYYIGRVYKNMMLSDLAEHYLNKFLQSIKASEDLGLKPVLGSDYLISAYYHLGELHFLDNDIRKAKEYFVLCTTLANTPHRKADEYLAKICDAEKKAYRRE